jgi:signal transduction histidine kinase
MVIQATKRYVNHATAISIVVLLVGILTMATGILHTVDAWRWVIHTREVLEHVETTHSLINEADALQKSLRLGYDRRDDADFKARLQAIPREVQVLTNLTSDNPVQQRTLADFRRLLARYTDDLRAGLDRTIPDPGRDDERALRQAVRAQVAALSGEEQRLLVLREDQVRHDRTRTIVASSAVSVLAIALLLFVRAMARRDADFLTEERSHLDTTLRSIGEAVIAVDVEGRVNFMNRVAEQLFGCEQGGARGQPLDAVLRFASGASQDFVPSSVVKTVLSGRRPAAGVLLSGSGEAAPQATRDWIFSCYPMAAGETLYGAVISMLDVTDLRQAQRELHEANLLLEQRIQERTEQLAEANIELRAFAHTAAHDLRAPLRNIEAYAAALLEDEAPALSSTGTRFVERIQVVAQRMDKLVTELLAYSQLSRAELRLQTVELAHVVRLALQHMEPQIEASAAQVEVAPGLPAALGDEGVLVQVVENLVGNAIKFVAPGVRPLIRIEGKAEGRHAYVWVSDNGIGIPADQRERVFEMFERLHGEEQYPGTGIGLAIVRKGMERLGGSVRVEPSSSSNGAVFRLCLLLPGAGQ